MSDEKPRVSPDQTLGDGSRGPTFLSQEDFSVNTYQIVAPDGAYDPETVPDLDRTEFLDLYRWMETSRIFSERMVQLQRRGEMGTYGSERGQEASIVGAGSVIRPNDWLFIGRGWTAMFMKGVAMRDMILFWRGLEDAGRYFAEHRSMITIPIGSHLPLVTGIGWGLKLTEADDIVTAFFGDGASSTGAAHEAINFAGVLGVPALLFCQNNQYAISTPVSKQTNATTLAQRALGYGIPALRVDGNDVLAVHVAVATARELVSTGQPVFIESVTYRRDAHTTSDDAGRYRSDDEVEAWARRDPIDRYRGFLQAEGLWDDIDTEQIAADINEQFDEALAAANAYEKREVDVLFDHVHGNLPPVLEQQLESLRAFLAAHPDGDGYIEQRPKG